MAPAQLEVNAIFDQVIRLNLDQKASNINTQPWAFLSY